MQRGWVLRTGIDVIVDVGLLFVFFGEKLCWVMDEG